jgi:predicted NBD/HSP70 family sugar kinase
VKRRYLALDVGGTKIEAGVVAGDGRIIAVNRTAARELCSIDELLTDIDRAIDPLTHDSVVGLGIGFPALGDYGSGILDGERSLYPCVGGFPLRDHLASRYGLPVRMTTDASLFTLGATGFGAGSRYRNVLALVLGTGLGVGLVMGGRLQTGSRGVPDELLHLLQGSHHPLWAAGHHFERLYGADGATLAARASGGDTVARTAFQTIGRSLGQTILRLLSVLPPMEVVLVGGGVSASWRFFSRALRVELGRRDIEVIRARRAFPGLSGVVPLFDSPDANESLPPGRAAERGLHAGGSP